MTPHAVIFASGAATRAEGYSGGKSKCLLLLPDGDVVLDKILTWLTAAGVVCVTMLTTYDPRGLAVQAYLKARPKGTLPIKCVSESTMGGTVSALRAYARSSSFLGESTLLLNHDTVLTVPFLEGMVGTFLHLNANVLDARAVTSGISSGVRLLSPNALLALTHSAERNVEDALTDPLVYPVPDGAFIDVGTPEGYDAARRHYACS